MSASDNTVLEPEQTVSGVRILSPYSPTAEEIAQAKRIPSAVCPRRYCWWWVNTRFEWQLAPAYGCVFLRVRKSPNWKHADTPCCRCDASSRVDHFEPRMPEIEEDGVDVTHWLHKEEESDEADKGM